VVSDKQIAQPGRARYDGIGYGGHHEPDSGSADREALYPRVKAPDGSDAWAATATLMQPSGLSTKPVKGGVGVATVNIAVSLNASASWVLTSHAEDAQLLEHERLLYMLAICLARKLHDDILKATKQTNDALQRELNNLRSTAARRVQQLSDQYDRESKNGRLADQQATWAMRIRGWFRNPSTSPG
jgi:hypothetical protein